MVDAAAKINYIMHKNHEHIRIPVVVSVEDLAQMGRVFAAVAGGSAQTTTMMKTAAEEADLDLCLSWSPCRPRILKIAS